MDRSYERYSSDADDGTGRRSEDRAGESDEERQRRRRRMSEGADSVTPSTGGNTVSHPGPGATGIDMGAGGEGTDVE